MENLLIIGNEPSPYMVDLYNAINIEGGNNLNVYYTKKKDWSSQSGHNFLVFPNRNYRFQINEQKGFWGEIIGCVHIIKLLVNRPNMVVINGYSSSIHILSLFVCTLLNIKFFFFGDYFIIPEPKNLLKRFVRRFLRHIVFKYSVGVLTCGKMGVDSAIQSGCPSSKVINFSYEIDRDRLEMLSQNSKGVSEVIKIKSDSTLKSILFFSGRLIYRKGLDSLLKAILIAKEQEQKFHLVIEGDGPMRNEYENMVDELNLRDCVSFVGFQQMAEHAWLLSNVDIVIVPSLNDPWGLAVPEAMLMGKAVIASNVVGSAVDRIIDGQNGFLFSPDNHYDLSQKVIEVINDLETRNRISKYAYETSLKYSPKVNAEKLYMFIRSNSLC